MASVSGEGGLESASDEPVPVVGRQVVERWVGSNVDCTLDAVAEEVPVALVYNGISHAVMLATPADIEDFGLGFSVTEGIVATPREVTDIEILGGPHGIEARMTLIAEREVALRGRRRTLAGRTGCGLCGTESLDHAIRECAAVGDRLRLERGALVAAQQGLFQRQELFAETGAVHAAAWCGADGTVAVVREDVGRHNALDKLIGALLRAGEDPARGFVLMTSRASYEIVQKAAAVGIEAVAAISAPTGMALRMAEAAGVTLVGFVRDDRCSVYTHPRRVRRVH